MLRILLVLLLAAPGASSLAQGAKSAPGPSFQSLRYEERWPAASSGSSAIGRLKHLPLRDDDRAFLTIGGQIRGRAERVASYLAESGPGRDDVYGSQRILLSADLWIAGRARLFVEGRDGVGYGRDLPGGRRTSDHDRWDLQNAFAELRAAGAALRAGRQELSLGRERIVGVSDWSNARRTYDGVRASVAVRGVTLDAFASRPVVVRSAERNVADSSTDFWGATIGGTMPRVAAWQLYALGLRQDSIRFAGITGAHRRLTLGGRADGTRPALGRASLSWEIEGAMQRGELADRDVRAWFAVAEVGAKLSAPWSPGIAIGADVSSGDDDPADARAGTFHQLFPSGHTHGGYADVIGRQNARELRVVLTASPVRPLVLRAAAHRFARQSLHDAAYAKSGSALRAATPAAGRALGDEADLTATWQAGRHLRVLGGYGHFAPGRYFRETTGGAHAVHWVFAGTTLTF